MNQPQRLLVSGQTSRLLFLIGYRGAGKSSVARALAARLGWDALDTDELIEARARQTIEQVFAGQGEPAFRTLEAAILDEVCRRENHVIATGGGVILRPENRQRMRSAGRVVWLTATPETLWQRIEADPVSAARRPALAQGGVDEVRAILAEREPLYRACADLIVTTDHRSPPEVAQSILAHWPAET